MNHLTQTKKQIIQAFILLMLGMPARVMGADFAVELFYTQQAGGNYLYDLTIRNNSTENVSIVSITDAPVNDLLIPTTLTTPVGFLANYDPIGSLDFVENTDLFGVGTTTSGFSFQSAAPPLANFTSFEALTSGGTLLSGSILAIPEPGIASLAIIGLGILAVARRVSSFNKH